MSTRAIQIELLLSGCVDLSGDPLVEGTVEFYAAGTSTPKNVWTEKEKSNPFTSITLDSVGQRQIYGEGIYKLIVKDSDGSTHYTWDDVKFEASNYYIRTITSSDTATTDDDAILVDSGGGDVTVTCAPAADMTHPLIIKNIGSNDVIVDPNASETIDGSATFTIDVQNMGITVFSDGSNLYSTGEVIAQAAELRLEEGIGSDHGHSGTTVSLTAGESVVFGDLCYYKSSDSKMWKSDADAASTMTFIGMAVATIAADSDGLFLLSGFARDDTWTWTVSGKVFASATAGELTQTEPASGDIAQCVGIATHANRMHFNPNHKEPESAKIKTGTYTGDGEEGQAITGVGFRPKYVQIWKHADASEDGYMVEKLDQTWGDYAFIHQAVAGDEHYVNISRINSLDSDGFTVDDLGSDLDPNTLGEDYDYLALG